MPKRLLRELSRGEPVSRVWIAFVAVGAVGTGLLSVPSSGPPIALIPLFLLAGAMCLWGSLGYTWMSRRRAISVLHGRPSVTAGLALMIMASWARAIAVWGVDQDGVGSGVIATFVWVWIALGCAMLLTSVSSRGMM